MNLEKKFRSSYFDIWSAYRGATVYDISSRLRESQRERRIKDLAHENELLARVLKETRSELVRLRQLLANFS
jgi:hypothetical protein